MTDLPSWCRVGAKVVCVDDFRELSRDVGVAEIYPAVGQKLTIRTAGVSVSGRVCLRFREIVNPKAMYTDGFIEGQFYYRHFAPLTSTKTEAEDLAYFKQFLQSSIETSHWKQEERVK